MSEELLDRLRQTEEERDVAREQVTLLREANRKLRNEVEQLRQRMDRMCRRMYGRKAEEVSPQQLALAFAEIEKEDAAAAKPPPAPEADSGEEGEVAPPPPPAKKKGHGRRRPPKNLPRERVEHLPEEEDRVCGCCRGAMVEIGEEVSEQYDYVPASVKVIEHVRKKFGCPKCKEGVVIAPPPPKVVEKGLAGPGLLAYVITSKFADHLPLYRQEEILAREGAELSRSTLLSFVRDTAQLLQPVARAVLADILRSRALHDDETPVKMKLRPSGVKTAYLWVYTNRQQVAYHFTTSRSRAGPMEILKEYSGYVHRDAYAGYEEAIEAGGATTVACMAHFRRKVYDALNTDPERATRILAFIAMLYRVESESQGLPDAERHHLRQQRSVPLLARLAQEMETVSKAVLPESPLGKAVAYGQNQWPGLLRYVEDPILAIDNNWAERMIKPVAIGRRNWLFAGGEAGGQWAAVHYTLMGSCKLQGINPFEYLRDVLVRLSTHPARLVDDLTPQGWKAARTVNPVAAS